MRANILPLSMKNFFSSLILFTFLANNCQAGIFVDEFKQPDIRNDYCGALIDFRFCKCGFHGDETFCNQIGHTDSSANEVVQDGFAKYVENERTRFNNNCDNNGGILSGDTCTYCTEEHFRYKDNCVTNEEMCGTDDPNLHFDVGLEKCECNKGYELGNSGLCEQEKIFKINFDWLDDKNPPFFADGQMVAQADVSVQALKSKEQELLPLNIHLITVTWAGILEVEDLGENQYHLTYTVPDLRENDPSKVYKSGINLNFKAPDGYGEMIETDEIIPILFAVETPVKISAFGFDPLETKTIFVNNYTDAYVKIMVGDEDYPVVGAKIELPEEKIFKTDGEGEVEIEVGNEALTEEQDENLEFTLRLNAEVTKQLSQVKSRMSSLGSLGQSSVINTFLTDFPEDFAGAEDDAERHNMLDGLKRLNYATFFVEKGEEFGQVSADSLATVTKDAVANMVDLLDSVLGITGKITDAINSKGAKLGEKAIGQIASKVDNIYKESLKKLGASMQAGINTYAPNSKIRISGLLRYLEDKFMISDNLKAKTAATLDLSGGIKEYFREQVREASFERMNEIEEFIAYAEEEGFPSLEYSADLDSAKDSYATMADKYIKAEQAEYWRAMTKSWFDLGFDTIGKGVSIIAPMYATVVSQIENMYKVARTAFVDAANMFQWYKTHQDIIVQIDRGLQKSLGQEVDYSAYNKSENFLALYFTAYADEVSDETDYMNAVADVAIYNDLAEIGDILAEEFPDEANEIKAQADALRLKSAEASIQAKELKSQAQEIMPAEEFALWDLVDAIPAEAEVTNKVSDNSGILLGGGAFLAIMLIGYFFLRLKK